MRWLESESISAWVVTDFFAVVISKLHSNSNRKQKIGAVVAFAGKGILLHLHGRLVAVIFLRDCDPAKTQKDVLARVLIT